MTYLLTYLLEKMEDDRDLKDLSISEVSEHCEWLAGNGLIRCVKRDPNDEAKNVWQLTDFGNWIFEMGLHEIVLRQDFPSEELANFKKLFEAQKQNGE